MLAAPSPDFGCPSCHQMRVRAYGDWVEQNALAPVPHRQYDFTVPRMLRPIFSRRRGLLGELCHIVERLLIRAYSGAGVEGRPGLILFVQTFGDLVTFNPHIHVLAADGLFRADGVFVVLPPIPVKLLEQGFRSEVLKLLVAERAIGERLSASMLAWRHSGFSVHNAVRAVVCAFAHRTPRGGRIYYSKVSIVAGAVDFPYPSTTCAAMRQGRKVGYPGATVPFAKLDGTEGKETQTSQLGGQFRV